MSHPEAQRFQAAADFHHVSAMPRDLLCCTSGMDGC
jgi:hypothetical protein